MQGFIFFLGFLQGKDVFRVAMLDRIPFEVSLKSFSVMLGSTKVRFP